MPAYAIKYTRDDMKSHCTAMKFAHTKGEALQQLCTGTEKKGLRLSRSGVPIKLIEIKEL
jgi:hypothetical protein